MKYGIVFIDEVIVICNSKKIRNICFTALKKHYQLGNGNLFKGELVKKKQK